jgi:DNA-binding NarL/FixJ family response regulator
MTGERLQSAIRVVLADDEELVCAGLRVILESEPDIQVVGIAANGAELVRQVAATPCDVVLVDVRMPGTDGLTALRRLVRSGAAPAIAVLTTFDFDEYVSDALEAGAMGFLLKDASPDFLRRAVHDLATGGAVLDPRIVARLLPRLRVPEPDPAAGGYGCVGAGSGRVAGAVSGGSRADGRSTMVQAARGLSQRERQVLDLVGDGVSNAEIAQRLRLAESTVKGYVSAVLAKLGAANRVQAALMAKQLQLLEDGR